MITDINQTIDAIVESSSLPMSVVIVGVQNEVRAAGLDAVSMAKRPRCCKPGQSHAEARRPAAGARSARWRVRVG